MTTATLPYGPATPSRAIEQIRRREERRQDQRGNLANRNHRPNAFHQAEEAPAFTHFAEPFQPRRHTPKSSPSHTPPETRHRRSCRFQPAEAVTSKTARPQPNSAGVAGAQCILSPVEGPMRGVPEGCPAQPFQPRRHTPNSSPTQTPFETRHRRSFRFQPAEAVTSKTARPQPNSAGVAGAQCILSPVEGPMRGVPEGCPAQPFQPRRHAPNSSPTQTPFETRHLRSCRFQPAEAVTSESARRQPNSAGVAGAQPMRGVPEGCPLGMNSFIEGGANKGDRQGARRTCSLRRPVLEPEATA